MFACWIVLVPLRVLHLVPTSEAEIDAVIASASGQRPSKPLYSDDETMPPTHLLSRGEWDSDCDYWFWFLITYYINITVLTVLTVVRMISVLYSYSSSSSFFFRSPILVASWSFPLCTFPLLLQGVKGVLRFLYSLYFPISAHFQATRIRATRPLPSPRCTPSCPPTFPRRSIRWLLIFELLIDYWCWYWLIDWVSLFVVRHSYAN